MGLMRHGWCVPIVFLGAACVEQDLSPVDVNAACPVAPTVAGDPTPEALVIDDLEDGDLNVRPAAGMDGSWQLWDDMTNPAVKIEVSDRCAARGLRAVHVSSPGQTGWGASANIFFRHPMPSPFDASTFGGVSFFIATGSAQPTTMPLKAGLTTMQDAWDSPECQSCMDTFGERIVIGPAWQRVILRYDDLKQDGWGRPANVAFRASELVQVSIPFTGAIDVWIDQIAFVPPPS